MKPRGKKTTEELRPEYDMAQLLKGGVRGKHAKAYHAGTNLVLIEPEVHTEFPTAQDVNEALRLVIQPRKIGSHARQPNH